MKELIERIEGAEGPSYALDCAIWDAIYPGERQARFDKLTAKGQPYHLRLGPADMDGYVKPLRSFTASLDAAMTLARHDGEAFGMLSDAMVQLEDDGWPKGEWAKTLPRYVAAAALKARGE